MVTMNKLKEKLFQGNVAFGSFLKLVDPAVVEIVANAGFDFVIIDQEHGPIGLENTQNMIRAAEVSGITPVVRISNNEEHLILRSLDIGAQGIEVPKISNKTQGEKLVQLSRFYPLGDRGVCRYVRSSNYSHHYNSNYFQDANSQLLVIAHIEGQEGIENLDDILDIEGIDVLFIGPYDLSQSIGIPGQLEDPRLKMKMEEVVKRCKKRSKIIGTFIDTPKDAADWIKTGVQFLACSVDVGVLYDGYLTLFNRLNPFIEQ